MGDYFDLAEIILWTIIRSNTWYGRIIPRGIITLILFCLIPAVGVERAIYWSVACVSKNINVSTGPITYHAIHLLREGGRLFKPQQPLGRRGGEYCNIA